MFVEVNKIIMLGESLGVHVDDTGSVRKCRVVDGDILLDLSHSFTMFVINTEFIAFIDDKSQYLELVDSTTGVRVYKTSSFIIDGNTVYTESMCITPSRIFSY